MTDSRQLIIRGVITSWFVVLAAATMTLSVSVDHVLAQDSLGLDLEEEEESTNPKDPEGAKPAIDPFRALIVPEKPKQPIQQVTPVMRRPSGPPPPPPPVNFQVVAIAGEDPNYVAVIDYKGSTHIVQPGSKVPPDGDSVDFEVKNVTSEKVEVYDPKAQRLVRRRLPSSPGLGGDYGGGDDQ